jgi:hypothetical protein
MSVTEHLIEFAARVRADRLANPSVAGDGTALELLIAPRFQALLESVLPEISPAELRVLPEYRVGGFGRPDLAFAKGVSRPRAFVELKEPRKTLNVNQWRGHDKAQFERFCGFPLWALSNYHAISLYERNRLVDQAQVLPGMALEPATSSREAERAIRLHDIEPFQRILRTLAIANPQQPANAEQIAEYLAHAAKLVRDVVRAQCEVGLGPAAEDVRAEFNETLFARAEAGGYDPSDMNALFSSAFAQTLVFGLLLAREANSGREIGIDAYTHLPNNSYPLLRATLRALTLDEMRAILGASFDVALDTVNSIDPNMLQPSEGRDPVLYLYENFLRVFDPEAVAKFGVYYTPPEIVKLIVSQTSVALRQIGTDGLIDPNVRILDPACGTGTFALGCIAQAAEEAETQSGIGMVGPVLSALAQRLYGFELLVGPYTVSHYRVLREIHARGGGVNHVPIYLADTLAPPAHEQEVESRLSFMGAPIVEERQAADQVKSGIPIIAIIGNPPYKRLKKGEVERLVGSDMNRRWEDLKRPVRDAGMGLSLNAFPDLYVAFYRWALWRMFEAGGSTGRGVLAFITNRNFLTGNGFGGLRKMLRERFDHIRIIDFRGENRGALPATVESDENIFNIEVGVCVLIAYATGNSTAADATVEYADVWETGAFTASTKRRFAEEAARDPGLIATRPVPGTGLAPLKPPGFGETDWPSIAEIMSFRSNGIVTYRDEFIYATQQDTLLNRLNTWSASNEDAAKGSFGESALNKFGPAYRSNLQPELIEAASYRPLDRRWLYKHANFVDRLRPELDAAWGERNVALISPSGGIGAGPSVWCHGLLPDQHSFRGSFGGWVFPLVNHNAEGTGHYFIPELMRALALAYGEEVPAQDVFDAILALLSATSYTTRFAHDLEDAFPHIPFPSELGAFRNAARIGSRIRGLQSFEAAPRTEFMLARLAGSATEPVMAMPTPARAFAGDGLSGALSLQADGSLRVSGVSQRAWDFTVSGYKVLYRWVRARNGENLSGESGVALLRGVLDIVGRIEELVALFDEADAVLEIALRLPLTRAAIGLQSKSQGVMADEQTNEST